MYGNSSKETNQEMLEDFLEESLEWIAEIQAQLIHMESGAEFDRDITVNLMFRKLHTLKGTAPFFGLMQVQSLSHALENLLVKVRENELEFSKRVIAVFLLGLNALFDICENSSDSGQEICDPEQLETVLKELDRICARKAETNVEIFEFLKVLEPLLNLAVIEGDIDVLNLVEYDALAESSKVLFALTQDPATHLAHLSKNLEDFRVAAPNQFIEKSGFREVDQALNKLLETESDVAENIASSVSVMDEVSSNDDAYQNGLIGESKNTDVSGLDSVISDDNGFEKERSVSALKIRRLDMDYLIDLVGELSYAMNVGVSPDAKSEQGVPADQSLVVGEPGSAISKTKISEKVKKLRNHLDEMMCAPLEGVAKKAPGLIRSVCGNLKNKGINKKVEVSTNCGDISVSEKMYRMLENSMTHLIRNAVDHGIETMGCRQEKGKPECGSIRITADRQGSYIRLMIQDDGAGVCVNAVKKTAIKNGLITDFDAEHMHDESVVNLILFPGFSTAENITDISGRGVGLDVVNNDIKQAGGSLEIKNMPGQGTIFIIKIPTTEKLFTDCVVAQVGEEAILIPLDMVKTICSVNGVDIDVSKNKLTWRGRAVACISLGEHFLNRQEKTVLANSRVVMTESAGGMLAIIVDQVAGEFCLVNKQLNINNLKVGVSGTINDGQKTYTLINPATLKVSIDCLF